MAAVALTATSRALASCPPGELNAASGRAEKAVRDHPHMRTKISAPTPTTEPPARNRLRAKADLYCAAPEDTSYRGRDSGGGWGNSGS